MVTAAVITAGCSDVLPLIPEFVWPRSYPIATALASERQQQDCESNAPERWTDQHAAALTPFGPGLLRH